MKPIKSLSQQEIIKRINKNTRASYRLFGQLLTQRPKVLNVPDSDHIERRLWERGGKSNY